MLDIKVPYRHMFSHRLKFPNIFVVNNSVTVGILNVMLLIGYTDRDGLFCSSRNSNDNFNSSTPFCTAVGWFVVY